jgi:excisionase family DNA binding protein
MTTLDDIAKRLDRLEGMMSLFTKNVLDINEVAAMTGYTVKYLRLLVSKREIPHYRRGNRLYFSNDEIEEWLLSNRIATNDEMNIKAMGYKAGRVD